MSSTAASMTASLFPYSTPNACSRMGIPSFQRIADRTWESHVIVYGRNALSVLALLVSLTTGQQRQSSPQSARGITLCAAYKTTCRFKAFSALGCASNRSWSQSTAHFGGFNRSPLYTNTPVTISFMGEQHASGLPCHQRRWPVEVRGVRSSFDWLIELVAGCDSNSSRSHTGISSGPVGIGNAESQSFASRKVENQRLPEIGALNQISTKMPGPCKPSLDILCLPLTRVITDCSRLDTRSVIRLHR